MTQNDNALEDQLQRATEVQAKYADYLMGLPNVIGVGVGYATKGGERTDEVSIVVMVDEKLPLAQLAPEAVIPVELDGVRIDVQAAGGMFFAG